MPPLIFFLEIQCSGQPNIPNVEYVALKRRHQASIITAAYAPLAQYFAETIDSVLGQELPPQWELEWLVQEDGADPQLADLVAGLPGVSYAANRVHAGIPVTRNLALSRATGELVQVPDHDDMLLPDALARLIPRFDGADTKTPKSRRTLALPRRCVEGAATPARAGSGGRRVTLA